MSTRKTYIRKGLWPVILLMVGWSGLRAGEASVGVRDSVYQQEPVSEYGSVVKSRMAASPFPVQLKVQGQALCVRSNYNQVLPVYNRNGVFFSMFRLSKGVNWVNGLPRGVYYVNNRKITIP